METKEITTYQLDLNNRELIDTLKATVAVNTTEAEFKIFTEFCKSTGLNPFKKEIWCIVTGKGDYRKMQLMTGINGFHAIANNSPYYDGIETGLIDTNGDYKTLAYPKADFIGAWCKVYRKDRRMPIEAVAMLLEYKKDTPIWKSMTRVMILKCAESVALRKAFPQELNGLYTQEEMPADHSVIEEKPIVKPIVQLPKNTQTAESLEQYGYAYDFEHTHEEIKNEVKKLLRRDKLKFKVVDGKLKTINKLPDEFDGYLTDYPIDDLQMFNEETGEVMA